MQTAAVPVRSGESYLTAEVALMGGLSILASLLVWLTVDKGSSLLTVSQLAFSLAFVFNHPHFLASYILLYGDFRSEILKRRRYFWAAVVAPAIIGGCLLGSLATGNQNMMAHIVTSMFFFVGWHYVKQVFGCIVVTSAQRKMYYSPTERRIILLNLFATWFVSWLSNQVGYGATDSSVNAFSFYGIGHYKLNIDPVFLKVTYGVMVASFVGIVSVHLNRYIRKGIKPSPPAVAAFVALYAWYIPAIIHPAFAYFIPLFHSLQYMAFVWALKRNQVAHQIQELSGEEWRRAWVNRFFGFLLSAAVLGALAFEFIPKALDDQNLVSGMGSSPFLASFLLFINIHHYFIDNVIWRSDNAAVKQFLFQPSVSNDSHLAPARKVA